MLRERERDAQTVYSNNMLRERESDRQTDRAREAETKFESAKFSTRLSSKISHS